MLAVWLGKSEYGRHRSEEHISVDDAFLDNVLLPVLADEDTVRKYGRGNRLNAVETPPRIKPQYLYWLMTWSVSEWRSSFSHQ